MTVEAAHVESAEGGVRGRTRKIKQETKSSLYAPAVDAIPIDIKLVKEMSKKEKKKKGSRRKKRRGEKKR